MAPRAPCATVLECNMCGHVRLETDFLAELQLHERYHDVQDME